MKTYLEPEDIELMERATGCLRDRLLIRLLFRLGCRVSEALALKTSDIDFERGAVTILHLKTRIRLLCAKCKARLGRRHQFCPECGEEISKAEKRHQEYRRQRALPVGRGTIDMLKEYIDRGPVATNGKQFLFGISHSHAWKIVKDCDWKAGLGRLVNPETGEFRGISPHRLRDAFAVHVVKLDDSGDGLRLLQEHLGHQSITTTLRYRKISGEEHREWYEKLWAGGEG